MLDRHRRTLTVLIAVALLGQACSGQAPSTSPAGPDQTATAGGTDPDAITELARSGVSLAMVDDLEAELARIAVVAAGLGDSFGGPDMLDAVEAARRAVAADAVAQALGLPPASPAAAADPLAGHLADAGPPTPPFALSGLDFSGSLAMTTALARQLMTNPPASGGSNSAYTSRDATRVTAGGRTADVTVVTTLAIVTSGAVLTAEADVTTTIAYVDANGSVVETVTTTSRGIVEVNRCPAADGSVDGHYSLDYALSSTAGASASFNVAGRVVGQVLDDAYLHGFTIDAQGATQGAGGIDRAVTVQATATVGSSGNTSAISVGAATATTVRADPNATNADMTELIRLTTSPAFMIVALLFEKAQEQWRSGACVEVDVQPGSSDVDPNERFQPFVVIKHKMDGQILRGLPVKGTMTGGQSFTPADTDVSTPYAFTYVATGKLGDVGKVHFISTSRRGIGQLDVEYTVTTDLVLELVIGSTFNFTKYTTFLSDAVVKVNGTIRMERDPNTNLWSGKGTLTSTTTSSVSGCNSVTITGRGTYDWMVLEARAEPGMPDSQLEVWMDAGPDPESFDNYTARVCPGPTLTGHVNLWENTFFLIESPRRYGVKAFHVTSFDSLGASTGTWSDGLVLGKIGWQSHCEDIPPVALPSGLPGMNPSDYMACIGNTYYTLRVVDPGP
ncbi:MAG TPA: hypothetical protein VFO50_05205 [Candidatus Limnocylindrales bacterium]|nr:hypothetical protein [Candidatus Limnocylindrales bacterium]